MKISSVWIVVSVLFVPSSPSVVWGVEHLTSPSGGGATSSTVAQARSVVLGSGGLGFDHVPIADAVEGVGFFTSHYQPPTTGNGWRLGVRYAPVADEHPLEYWALISGTEYVGNTFNITGVPIWGVDIHSSLDHFIDYELGDVYHAEYPVWDHGSQTPFATSGGGFPIHLIGFDINPGVSLRSGVEYVISISILDGFGTNGFAGVTQFPGELVSAVQVSGQLSIGWHFTSDSPFNQFSGGICTRLVSALDICPNSEDPTDSDGDGTFDRCDGCPFDPDKIDAGLCGCGTSDIDADADGIADCFPIISARIVKLNPTCVGGGNAGQFCVRDCDCDSLVCGGDRVPSDNVVVNPGGTVIVEFFGAHWSPNGERLRAYELRFEAAAPTGYLQIPSHDRCCSLMVDCASARTPCQDGVCVTPTHPNPDLIGSVFSDITRPDYVFYGHAVSPAIDVSAAPLYVRYSDLVLVRNDAYVFDGSPRYFGSVVLTASTDASGTFSIGVSEIDSVLVEISDDLILPLLARNATITVQAPTCGNGTCEPGEDDVSCRADCYVPTCGDGACEPEEDDVSCPADCYMPICGDGACEAGEDQLNCSQDCLSDAIPTASVWGLLTMTLLLLVGARIRFLLMTRV